MSLTGLSQMSKFEIGSSKVAKRKSAIKVKKKIGGACMGNHIAAIKYILDTKRYCGNSVFNQNILQVSRPQKCLFIHMHECKRTEQLSK